MNQDTVEENRPSRYWKWGHPLLLCGMAWLFSAQFTVVGILLYMIMPQSFRPGRVPGVDPIFPIAGGLAIGLIAVLWAKRRLQNRIEEEAEMLVFPKRYSGLRLKASNILPHLLPCGIILAIEVIFHFNMQSGIEHFGPPALIGMGATFAPVPLQYSERLRIYRRAKEIATQSSEDAATYRSRVVEDTPTWPTVFGVFSVIAFLALGIWLQWGLPAAARAEPEPYTTTAEAGGRATRLTYGVGAYSPAISPDGNLIAYVRSYTPHSYLEIMQADGSGKRRINTRVSPSMFAPLEWSPDGSHILAIGEPYQPVRNWLEMPNPTQWRDLWLVDIATGKARRLTHTGVVERAAWIGRSGRIAVLESTQGGARLWLGDQNAQNVEEVADVVLPRAAFAFHLWHGQQDIVFVGTKEFPGIWSVDTNSGKATQLSDIAARWAVPLDSTRLVIGVRGQAHPPHEIVTSIAIFDSVTKDTHWVIRDIQGPMSQASLLREPPFVFLFSRAEENAGLWALDLSDGELQRLMGGRHILQVLVDPHSKSLLLAQTVIVEDKGFLSPVPPEINVWRFKPERPWETW